MAGHPTIGTTFMLAAIGRIKAPQPRLTLDLKVGPTAVDLEWHEDGRLAFAWMNQRVPDFGRPLPDDLRGALARALNLHDADLLPLPLQTVSSGVPFFFVPLVSEEAVDRASADRLALAAVFKRAGEEQPRPVFVFAMSQAKDRTCYSRMFAPEFGIPEDPATGGASGPLGCYILTHGLADPQTARAMVSLQGARMKRPSRISISVAAGADGAITGVRVGGQARLVGRGDISDAW